MLSPRYFTPFLFSRRIRCWRPVGVAHEPDPMIPWGFAVACLARDASPRLFCGRCIARLNFTDSFLPPPAQGPQWLQVRVFPSLTRLTPHTPNITTMRPTRSRPNLTSPQLRHPQVTQLVLDHFISLTHAQPPITQEVCPRQQHHQRWREDVRLSLQQGPEVGR